MDRELIKDIVGRPKWWLINVPLIVVFIVLAGMVWPKDADGAGLHQVARICPAGEWSCYTADRYANEFKDERFENSRGVELW